MSRFPQQCFVCPRWAYDNSCGHFTGPLPLPHAMDGNPTPTELVDPTGEEVCDWCHKAYVKLADESCVNPLHRDQTWHDVFAEVDQAPGCSCGPCHPERRACCTCGEVATD